MKRNTLIRVILAGIFFIVSVFIFSSVILINPPADELIGAWKGKVQFKTGEFSEVKDLEFMRVFNAGGTMTESSNYDEAPPVPPAYGVWKKTGENQYEAKYEFYITTFPAALEDIAENGGFTPAGYGIISEKITVEPGGNSYRSVIKFDSFDNKGNKTGSGDEAEAEARRINF